MTSREFKAHLTRRAHRAHVRLSDSVCDELHAYIELLRKWNAKINLTALPLQPPTDETIDRLLVEPLVASRHVPDEASIWFDLGSGGGSPAIPLKIVRPALQLTMIESKARKAAFLREVTRTLELESTQVENVRFEELLDRKAIGGSADLVTVRAVRADQTLAQTAGWLLKDGGRLFLFRPSDAALRLDGFAHEAMFQLTAAPRAYLATFRRVFHVEQSD